MRVFGVIGPLYDVDMSVRALAGVRGCMMQFSEFILETLGGAWPMLEELRLPSVCGNEGGKPLAEVRAWLDCVGDSFPCLRRLTGNNTHICLFLCLWMCAVCK